MPIEPTGVFEQRLLPAAIEDRLVGWFGRTGGVVLLALTAALWASVITWSIADPSLTHATGGAAGNILGIPGAIISDLMLQTLGLGAIVALLPPLLWSLDLLATQRIRDFRTKASMYPLAALLLAGGLSALPTVQGWPLNHGYGGILGDLVFGLAGGAFGVLNPARGSFAGGLVLFVGGGAALLAALGADLKDIVSAIARDRTSLPPTLAPHANEASARAVRRGWIAWPLGRRGRGVAADASTAATHPVGWDGQWNGQWNGQWGGQMAAPLAGPFTGHWQAAYAGTGYPAPYPHPAHPHGHGFVHAAPLSPTVAGYAAAPAGGHGLPRSHDPFAAPFGHPAPLPGSRAAWSDAGDGDEQDADSAYSASEAVRDPGFDLSTDETSRSIAERFAPSAGVRAAAATADASNGSGSPPVQPPVPPARKLGPGLLSGMSFRRAEPHYKRPPLTLLKRPAAAKLAADHTPAMQRGTARLLEDVLADFGVKGEIKDIRPGPVVTLFEFEPARGTKSSRVIGLADDIARSMSATAVRVAIVPGRNAIGIELPNARRETVLLRELLEAESFRSADATLPITLGKSIGGEPVVADLARMPHLLVAGTTGSGKSVGVNTMILSLLFRHAPEDCRFLMIDPKMLELSVYNGIPHLLTPVVTDPQKAVAALNWAVGEMEERYKRMSQLAVRNIEVFNNRVRNARKRGEMMSRTVQTGFDARSGAPVFEEEKLALEPMPYIVIVVDEFADLMVVAGKEIEAAVQRLAQMARAAGIHLVMATQRPSVDIVTGTIKANFPTRISFKVASKIDSRTILNDQGAEQLLGQGDMLYAGSAGGQPVRVHGAFVADEEVEQIVAFLKSQGTPRYVDGVTAVRTQSEPAPGGDTQGSEDDLYDRAVAVVLRDGKASTSYVQRRLSIGYNRAADLIERMEREGLIGPANAVGKREILAGRDPGGAHAA